MLYSILSLIIFLVTYYQKESKISQFLDSRTTQEIYNYDVLYDKYKKISKIIFDTKININQVKEIFSPAKDANKKEKAFIREKLYKHLKDTYNLLHDVNIKQLHFHLPNNDSFLRFHKPSKFGDNLSNIRETVKYVNENKKPVDGFEEGRIYNGYRFVFPLSKDNEHLGSVEVSFSTLALSLEYIENYKEVASFLISSSVIKEKVFNSEKSTYVVSKIKGYSTEKKILSAVKNKIGKKPLDDISDSLLEKIDKNIADTELNYFSIYDHKNNKIFTFLKVRNPINNKAVGLFVISKDAGIIVNATKNFYTINLLSNILILIVLFFIYKEITYRQKIAKVNRQLNKSLKLFDENVIASNSDLNGHITYVSEALCKTTGYTKSELIGRPHSIFRHPDTPKKTFRELWNIIQSGNEWSGELRSLKKDGGFLWFSVVISPEFNEKGEIIGYGSIKQDISPQKAKEQFMANMSHELRTPLNAIIGFSKILTKKQIDNSLIALSKQITTSSDSLLNLINDILDLSKINDDKFTINPYQFNAYSEIEKLYEKFEVLISKKQIHFNSFVSKNLKGTFIADFHRVEQIILNLISNAMKFTDKDGTISCEIKYVDNLLIITIEDDGIGMSKEAQDKIFLPFIQADGSTTRKYGGTGLGLSITQKLIEMMQGKIELESKEGAGSTFKVMLPIDKISDDYSELNSIQEEVEKVPLEAHILVAEDNKTNQMLIKMLLEDFGITCDIANDGLEAVKLYNPERHAIILMDESMPNMNGLEAMKFIKEKYQNLHIPIIALTANAMQGDKEKFISLGMDDYVAKPIDDDVLYESIKKALNESIK